MTKKTTNLAYTAVACLITVGVVFQQKEKRVQLPAVTVQEFNIIMQAFQECDCPARSTAALSQSFLNSARTQAPDWFQGYKPDSSKTKKP